MRIKTIYFISLLFTALSVAPAMAHLLALPNKIHLSPENYIRVQQIYRGWSLLGSLQVLALLSNLVLTIMTRRKRVLLLLNGSAFLSMLTTLVIFFLFTFPANQQTDNWTRQPENMEQLRHQWEYSHAVNAILLLLALMALIISVLKKADDRQ